MVNPNIPQPHAISTKENSFATRFPSDGNLPAEHSDMHPGDYDYPRDEDIYNRDGFDAEGFDIYGEDTYGFNRDGEDMDGFRRDGFNGEGINSRGWARDGLHGTTGTQFNPTGISEDSLSLDPASLAPEGTGPVPAVRHFLMSRNALEPENINAAELGALLRYFSKRGDRSALLAFRRILRSEYKESRSSYDFWNPGQSTWYGDDADNRKWGDIRRKCSALSEALNELEEELSPPDSPGSRW